MQRDRVAESKGQPPQRGNRKAKNEEAYRERQRDREIKRETERERERERDIR